MTAILGISAFYHDSAAALIIDGEIIAAAQEERFTRKKHDPSYPLNAINYCLSEAGLSLAQVDHIAFYDKPFLKFERLIETYVAFAPKGLQSFRMAMPVWLREKLFLKYMLIKEIKKILNDLFNFSYLLVHQNNQVGLLALLLLKPHWMNVQLLFSKNERAELWVQLLLQLRSSEQDQ